jgi:hypothetical protein
MKTPMTDDYELCGIEFFAQEYLDVFLRHNPALREAPILAAGRFRIVLIEIADFQTREISELFDVNGRHIGNFIGPDALRLTYQIESFPIALKANKYTW